MPRAGGQPHPGSRVPADDVLRIARTNGPPGLIIAGEIDESSYPLLLESLAALDRRDDVHVDLGGVEFCDLAGLRAIVCAAEPGGAQCPDAEPAREVVLHAVPARLRKILRILGWDSMRGVAFDDGHLPPVPPPTAEPRPGPR